MEWINVTSSNINRIRYENSSMTLEIEFKTGSIYQYFDVPEMIFNELQNADSTGKCFNEQIRGHFRYARI
jgi:hypothetical protein